MSAAEPEFTGEERASLAEIWDQLYQLYLEKANGGRSGPEIEVEDQRGVVGGTAEPLFVRITDFAGARCQDRR